MPLIKFLLPLFLLVFLSACAGNKKVTPKKKKDTNTSSSYAYLGTLSPEQEIVKKELIDYLKDIETFNVDSIVEKTYPKLFQVINEQHFREYISTMMNSKDIMVQNDTNITHLSKVKTFSNGTKFCQVDYNSNTKISLLNNNLYKSEESMNYLYDVFIHKYGRKNILFNIKERTITIKREEKLIVIKEQDEPWKFIADNLNYRRVYADILPTEILSNLDK